MYCTDCYCYANSVFELFELSESSLIKYRKIKPFEGIFQNRQVFSVLLQNAY